MKIPRLQIPRLPGPTLKTPRLSGQTLAAIRRVAETRGADVALRAFLKTTMGIDRLAELPERFRGPLPMQLRPIQARPAKPRPSASLPLPVPGTWPRTVHSFASAYRDGKLSPHEVADRVLMRLDELGARRPCMNILAANDPPMTLRDAAASADRFARGCPLGPLDGVPFLVKDQCDVDGLSTRDGSICEPDTPAAGDSTIVSRLRKAGAVFSGKTVLTLWGMSPIGNNTDYAMPHNVHDATRAAGGSSTGSAVGVALGIAPFAIGTDGGGSIRIPASLNGVFGIKPTFGRVPRSPTSSSSVAHTGPIASSARDLATFLDVVASEPCPEDSLTSWAPAPPEGGFGAYLGSGVRGLRIGIDELELRQAQPDIVRAVERTIRTLEKEGAEIVRIEIPMAKYAPAIGYLSISPEEVAIKRDILQNRRSELPDDIRLMFAIVEGFSCGEYLDAQRLRSGLRIAMAELLREVDVIALPTTAITAPSYTEAEERLPFSDPTAIDGLCRFNFLGNLTGLPAGTAPIGMDSKGLPIGLQIVGDAWDEPTVLSVLAHLERIGVAEARRPPGAVDLLA
jgi:aspartyl-tRNA(Asn)/glutamyl-tRNA(Gln) amidotransferase subunit A